MNADNVTDRLASAAASGGMPSKSRTRPQPMGSCAGSPAALRARGGDGTSSLNRLAYCDLAREVGGKGVRELELLFKFLGDFDPREPNWAKRRIPRRRWQARYAPSIILRSELELFNLSMPRFAIRVYDPANKRTFVNARRLATFADQARTWARRPAPVGPEPLDDIEEDLAAERSPGWIINSQFCVADSLLQVPARFALVESPFHTLQVRLGQAYGETSASEEDWSGVPYVRHINLAGGLCAQANAFMATMLLHEHTRSIDGIIEITKKAAGKKWGELRLGGLSTRQLTRYFSSVDLTGSWQRYGSYEPEPQQMALATALRSYLCSGFPVILPVDYSRLRGSQPYRGPQVPAPGIIAANGLSQIERAEEFHSTSNAHAVIAVGCRGNEFLLNDPGSLPFLRATAAHIYHAAAYRESRLPDQETREQVGGLFCAVTPSKVKLTLTKYELEDEVGRGTCRYGLAELFETLQLDAEQPDLYSPGRPWHDSLFRLTCLGNLGRTLECLVGETAAVVASEVVNKVELLIQKSRREHACWLQVTPTSLLVWDAEREPLPWSPAPSREEAQAFLLIEQDLRGSRLRLEELSTRFLPEQARQGRGPAPFDQAPAAIGVCGSVLTSCCVSSLQSALAAMPAAVRYCELYAFMQEDAVRHLPITWRLRRDLLRHAFDYTLKVLWKNITRFFNIRDYYSAIQDGTFSLALGRKLAFRWPFCSAQELMAAHADHPDVQKRLARTLIKWAHGRSLHYSSVATFLPEISSSFKGRRVESVAALKFILRLTGELIRMGEPVSAVEMVGGSAVDGVWVGKPKFASLNGAYSPTYVASILPDDACQDALLESLSDVAGDVPAGCKLVVEMEPGELFTIRDRTSLDKFLKRLQNADRQVQDVTRINLDIGHFQLAGVPSSAVFGDPLLACSIQHMHISDHWKGHLGDLPPATVHNQGYFYRWLREVQRARRKHCLQGNSAAPRVWAALELEACLCTSVLNEAVESMRRLGIEFENGK